MTSSDRQRGSIGPGATIGLVGLGNMGLPMATLLLGAGYDVRGYDRQPSAGDALEKAGGTVVGSGAELGSLDVLLLMLPDSDAVEAVLLGAPGADDGLIFRDHAPRLVVDMSSSEPLRTRALAERLAAHDIALLDAPVSGGVRGAELGSLTVMVGGDADAFTAVEPVLTTFGKVVHVGSVGSGHALKALNNLLSAAHLWASSEVVLTAQRFGLDPAVVLDVVNGSSGRCGSTERKWPDHILTGRYDSGFALSLMHKDMRIATGLARELGVPLDLGDAVEREWTRARESLSPVADHTEVARYLADVFDGSAPVATQR